MSSVLAIVSKALFEKMVPKDVKLGVVVDTNEYTSSNKTFEGLKKGGAIFLVTVRPPSEKLWLVGILESPKKKGDVWKAADNEAPLTDITSAIKKLKFESGTGITAKKGTLGMSLQTPRSLTDADVKVLRGLIGDKPKSSAKLHANEAYKKAVDEVVHHKKGGAKLGKFRLDNHRKPYRGKLADISKSDRAQLQAALGKRKIESMFVIDENKERESDELVETEITDVIDTASGKVLYQLMIWPYGDGTIVKNGTTKVVAQICQHSVDASNEVGKAWMRDFANAWLEGSKRLKMWTGHIDFDEDDFGDDAADDE